LRFRGDIGEYKDYLWLAMLLNDLLNIEFVIDIQIGQLLLCLHL